MRRTRLVASLAVASAASASLLFAAPALAYPPHHCSSISSNSIPAGGSGHARACGFSRGELVKRYGHSTPVYLGSSIASATGEVSFDFTVPADFPAGSHTLEMIGQTSGHVVDIPFTVPAAGGTGATSTSSGSTLPFTGGNDVWQMTLAGVVLVGVGGSLLVVRRRRTHPSAV